MSKAPKSVEIRGYQVGFGDCFLLSFFYGPKDTRHVLIDFGTTGLPGGRKRPAAHMPEVAKHIAQVCGGRLTAVVATHRHADHINGFGTDAATGKSGEIIRALRPRVVLQPWTEDPDAKTDATAATRDSNRTVKSFVAGLAAMQDVARVVRDIAKHPPAWMGPSLQAQLDFLGSDNIANESAVTNLIAMGEAKGARSVWAHHGSRSGLESKLPGVRVHVLGPPNLQQSTKIRTMRRTDPDEFWHFLAGDGIASQDPLAHGLPLGRSGRAIPPEVRWFRDRLNRMRGDQLLQIVRTLDAQMNNTSLILLFEVFGKKMLFPGDAQIENWSYALKDAPDAAKTCALLAGVDVYKVGHHGSLNATPRRMLWEQFAKRNTASFQTLLSTMPGKHGRTTNSTEVPRRTLLKALEKESTLENTNRLKFGKKETEICFLVNVTP